MDLPTKLYKTTIVIWTDYNPVNSGIEALAREATSGDAFCSEQNTEEVTDHALFPETEFFGVAEESDEEEERDDQ